MSCNSLFMYDFIFWKHGSSFLTEHGLQDGFIVDGADEAGPHRLVQWILDSWEVACGCQFRRRLSRLPLDGAPELVTFPHCELRRVIVT